MSSFIDVIIKNTPFDKNDVPFVRNFLLAKQTS